jgi:hypothetical protein
MPLHRQVELKAINHVHGKISGYSGSFRHYINLFKLFRETVKNYVTVMAIISSQRIDAVWKIKMVSFPVLESRLVGSKPSHCTDWIVVKGRKNKKIGDEWYKMSHKEEARSKTRERRFCVRKESHATCIWWLNVGIPVVRWTRCNAVASTNCGCPIA